MMINIHNVIFYIRCDKISNEGIERLSVGLDKMTQLVSLNLIFEWSDIIINI